LPVASPVIATHIKYVIAASAINKNMAVYMALIV
jgi:hypothetical protein